MDLKTNDVINLYGAHVLMHWFYSKGDSDGEERHKIEAVVSKRVEWTQIFFDASSTGGTGKCSGGSEELMRKLTKTAEGRLLCNCVYWALHK